MSDLPPGLYDQLIDTQLSERLETLEARRLLANIAVVDAAELPDRVSEVIGRWGDN